MKKVRIVLLEDSRFDLELIKLELDSNGLSYDLTWVKNADTFVAELKTGNFDIILSDYNVPGFNGIEAVEYAKRIGFDGPFIYVSGQMGEELAIEALKAGATDYLLKSNIRKLDFCIKRALKEHESEKARKAAVKEAVNTSRYLQILTKYAPFVIIHYDVQRKVKYVNDIHIRTFLGSDLSKVDILQLVDDDDRLGFLENISLTVQKGVESTFDVTLRSNGRHYLAKSAPLQTRDEEYILVLIDITEKWQAQKLLEESELKFRKLSENLNVPVFIYQDVNFVYVNDAAARETGYTEEELLAIDPAELIGVEEELNALNEMGSLFSSGKKFEDVVKVNIKGGGTAHFIASVNRIIYNNRKALIGSAINITQLQQSYIEKGNLVEQLRNKNEVLENYAYIVSHNLRAPMSNIMGLVNLAMEQSRIPGFDLSKIFSMMNTSVEALDSTLKDLVSSISFQQVEDDIQPIDLSSTITQVIEGMGEQARDVEVTTHFQAFKKVRGTRAYVSSIFHNLLENAMKYRHVKRPLQVHIETQVHQQGGLIVVSDNGIGIDLEKVNKSRIFGLYQRFNNDQPGKGLGLFIVKNQAQALGWDIDVESTLGEGTKFILRT